jgi:hypothetical protein
MIRSCSIHGRDRKMLNKILYGELERKRPHRNLATDGTVSIRCRVWVCELDSGGSG